MVPGAAVRTGCNGLADQVIILQIFPRSSHDNECVSIASEADGLGVRRSLGAQEDGLGIRWSARMMLTASDWMT